MTDISTFKGTLNWGMKHKAITKDITTGATNDIRNYESTHATNKYVTHDVINDGTTDLAHDTHTHAHTHTHLAFKLLPDY